MWISRSHLSCQQFTPTLLIGRKSVNTLGSACWSRMAAWALLGRAGTGLVVFAAALARHSSSVRQLVSPRPVLVLEFYVTFCTKITSQVPTSLVNFFRSEVLKTVNLTDITFTSIYSSARLIAQQSSSICPQSSTRKTSCLQAVWFSKHATRQLRA
jgi:ABC-type siderophore export system fused ATPase/permease subunit